MRTTLGRLLRAGTAVAALAATVVAAPTPSFANDPPPMCFGSLDYPHISSNPTLGVISKGRYTCEVGVTSLAYVGYLYMCPTSSPSGDPSTYQSQGCSTLTPASDAKAPPVPGVRYTLWIPPEGSVGGKLDAYYVAYTQYFWQVGSATFGGSVTSAVRYCRAATTGTCF